MYEVSDFAHTAGGRLLSFLFVPAVLTDVRQYFAVFAFANDGDYCLLVLLLATDTFF